MGRLYVALLITLVVAALEFFGAHLSHSFSLASDGAHMGTDVVGLGVAIVVGHRARKKETRNSKEHIEARGAHLNMGVLAFVGLAVIANGVWHLFEPPDIQSLMTMFGIAAVGLVANIVVLLVLHPESKDSRNVAAAFVHVLADTATSLVVILAAAVIAVGGANIIDPVASICVGTIILAVALIRSSHLHEQIQVLQEQEARLS